MSDRRLNDAGVAESPPPMRAVTGRALLIVAVLTPLNTCWLYLLQEVWQAGNPTAMSLYFNVIFILALLTGANALVRRVSPRIALTQGELLVIYVLLCITSSCAGYDSIHWILPDTTGVIYRNAPHLGWEKAFFKHLPQDLIMQDRTSLRWLFEGGRSFYGYEAAWRPWITPVLWWIGLLTPLWLAPLGLAVITRKRWEEEERLGYPIVQVPLELTRDRPTVMGNKLFWIAGMASLVIPLLNAVHSFYPSVPAVLTGVYWDGGPPSFNLSRFLDKAPWNAAHSISLCFGPLIIGFGLLMPTELLTSCVLFFFVFKGQDIMTRWLGLEIHPGAPFIKEQSFGGYIAIVIFSLWIGRAYYGKVFRRILGREPCVDAREPAGYQSAGVIFLIGLAAVVLISWSAGPTGMEPGSGMSLSYALIHWVMYYGLTLVAGRLRAELGTLNHELERLGPGVFLGNVFGVLRRRRADSRVVRSLTVASVFFSQTRGMRSIAFPHELEGFKLMGSCGGDSKALFKAMFGAIIFGVIVAWAVYLPVVYHFGAGTAKMVQYSDWATYETYNQLAAWINQPKGLDLFRVIPMLVGFCVYGGMMLLRTQTSWWTLHPLGYALSSTYGMLYWWCPFLIALTLKAVTIRYAGYKQAGQLRALAFGLILGDTLGTCLASFSRLMLR